jgi:hypothetical protein
MKQHKGKVRRFKPNPKYVHQRSEGLRGNRGQPKEKR